jgi:hypothetical protein
LSTLFSLRGRWQHSYAGKLARSWRAFRPATKSGAPILAFGLRGRGTVIARSSTVDRAMCGPGVLNAAGASGASHSPWMDFRRPRPPAEKHTIAASSRPKGMTVEQRVQLAGAISSIKALSSLSRRLCSGCYWQAGRQRSCLYGRCPASASIDHLKPKPRLHVSPRSKWSKPLRKP